MADLKKPVDPQQEIEMQVNELEERVDRLRAIYEQYFMGYEKLEPAIPRKDVDRRFANLRKINIRNTALRFRFNVVTQKFNTYAMYWTRICRQIEEGTFKRHVIKANKRFGVRAKKDEFSIDVELGDFEVDMDDFDSDAATAEALAEAEAHADAATTEPPKSMPKSSPRLEMPTDRPAAAAGFGAIDDEFAAPDTLPPASVPAHQQRAMRSAVLPAGLKQRVLVKKGPASIPGGDTAPSSTPSPPQVRPRMPSVSDHTPAPMASPGMRARMPSVPEITPAPMASPMRGRMPSVPEQAPPSARPRMPSVGDQPPPSVRAQLPSSPEHAPSTSVIRAAAPHVHRSPPGVNRPAISPTAQSVNRVAVAKPAGVSGAPNPAPSVQRIATAAPNPPNAAPSVQRIPVAARAPSATAPNPSLGRPPSTAPGAGPASTPRVPVAPRVPVGLPSSVARTPAAPAVAPKEPAPSERKMPAPPPVRPGGMPAAAVRPPAPSAPAESERNPVPSRRPPPPLPSTLKKP